jgi:hypothetical protein
MNLFDCYRWHSINIVPSIATIPLLDHTGKFFRSVEITFLGLVLCVNIPVSKVTNCDTERMKTYIPIMGPLYSKHRGWYFRPRRK